MLSALWIAYSDAAVLALTDDPELLTTLQTQKGWAFVGGSTLLLFGVIAWYGRAVERWHERSRREAMTLKQILDTAPNAMALLDETGGILRANPAFYWLLGRREPDLVGRNLAQLAPPHAWGHPDLGNLLERARSDGDATRRVVLLDGHDAPLPAQVRLTQQDVGGASFIFTGIDLQAAEEARDRLSGLHAMSKELASNTDVRALMPRALEVARQLVRGDIAGIAVTQGAGEQLAYRWAVGLPDGVALENLTGPIARNTGVAGMVLESGKTRVIEDYRSTTRGLATFREIGVRSVIGVPIRWRGQVNGALIVATVRASGAFSPEDGLALETLAAKLGSRVEREPVTESTDGVSASSSPSR